MECADSRHVTLCDADSRGFIVVAFCSAILHHWMCKIPTEVATLTIYLSSQQATRYFGKLPLRVVMRFVFFRSKLRGIRPLAIDRYKPDKRYYCNNLQPPSVR
ncbi:hypothetical protein PsalMR5_03000 [Piscirickettsia salmonis]|nr:hypothetical protein PsalSR1_02996 [Piscirickettsia salmonis]QGP58612.1 hypothetical protein PsalBI1_01184 [Piscirickettsia salmonis]QGP65112.1 hypothetical protein PsalMR5_03000 [Piscirickettsia salmonis]